MNKKEFRKKWVEALRSGKFKQTIGNLCDDVGYCCLGVACEIFNQLNPDNPLEVKAKDDYITFDGCGSYLPIRVQEALGLREATGLYNHNTCQNQDSESLAEKNDQGVKFKDIADIIEAEPEGLFLRHNQRSN